MPYFYLYDTYTSDRVHANSLVRIENTLTDLGIQGRIGRLTILKSAKELIESALKDGADTIVTVGNDLTVSKAAIALASKKQNVTLGIIPIGEKDQSIAKLLGIPIGVLACHVLSSRIVEQIDLGKVNNQYFIRSVTIAGTPTVSCDEQFTVALSHPHNIKINNLDIWELNGQTKLANPKNKMFETVLTPLPQKNFLGLSKKVIPGSQLVIESCRITSPGNSLPVVVDGERVLKTPVTIKVAAQHLRVIVGKKRLI
ncbi:MAG: diacylglycerol kinase family protein [Patescibacteria group bacterium]